MGLLEKSKNIQPEETPEEEYAHEVLVRIEDKMSYISPFRVVVAKTTICGLQSSGGSAVQFYSEW